jgi:hypothetical protein
LADVFISYKSERRNAAQHLSRILELNGYSVWFDYGLLSGSDFGPQIERELRAAKAVVVLWCSLSRESPWVLEEAHLAVKLGTFTPVWLERVDPPLGFARADTIDLSVWDGAPRSHLIDRLFIEIARRVGRDPAQQFRGLQEYEQIWRSFGAPPLTRFALTTPVSAHEHERFVDQAADAMGIDVAGLLARANPNEATSPNVVRVAFKPPALPIWRHVVRYLIVPLVVLLVCHYVVVNVLDLNTNYLGLASVLVPFATGFAFFWINGFSAGSATAFALALALVGVIGMTISESLYTGDPMLPQTRFEWINDLQFAGMIALSFLVGHLMSRISRGLVGRKGRRADSAPTSRN